MASQPSCLPEKGFASPVETTVAETGEPLNITWYAGKARRGDRQAFNVVLQNFRDASIEITILQNQTFQYYLNPQTDSNVYWAGTIDACNNTAITYHNWTIPSDFDPGVDPNFVIMTRNGTGRAEFAGPRATRPFLIRKPDEPEPTLSPTPTDGLGGGGGSEDQGRSQNDVAAIGAGVGVGVTLFLVALFAGAWWWRMQKQRKRRVTARLVSGDGADGGGGGGDVDGHNDDIVVGGEGGGPYDKPELAGSAVGELDTTPRPIPELYGNVPGQGLGGDAHGTGASTTTNGQHHQVPQELDAGDVTTNIPRIRSAGGTG